MQNISSEAINLRDYRYVIRRKPAQINNRRILPFLMILIIVLALALFSIVRLANSSEPIKTIQVIVNPGDTLWSIARSNYDPSGDMRRYVYQIRRLNNLGTALIYPGQILNLPVD